MLVYCYYAKLEDFFLKTSGDLPAAPILSNYVTL